MKMTKNSIECLHRPDKTAMYWDDDLPGFGIRVTTTGVKSFILQQRINGRSKRMTIGRFGAMTVEQARKLAKKNIGAIAGGGDPVRDNAVRKARSVTLGRAAEDYLASRKSLAEQTKRNVRDNFKRYLNDWNEKELTAITGDMVKRRHAKIGKRTPAAANLCMRYLRTVFNFAASEYETPDGSPALTDNPVEKLNRTRAWYRVDRRKSLIQMEDLADWWAAVDGLASVEAQDFFKIVLLTGLRRSEALGLRWGDVDLQGRRLVVRDTKNHDDHELPITRHMQKILERRASNAAGEYVLQGPRGRLSNLRGPINCIEQETGQPFSPHDCRRTFATIAGLQVPAYVLKRLLNHKQAGDVTAGYVQLSTERMREPLQGVEDVIISATGIRQSAEVVRMEAQRR